MKQSTDINKFYLFLVGVFSMTQINVIGWIGISELVLFILAPIFFIKDRALLRKHGFLTVIYLSVLMFLGGNLANWVNEIPIRDALRGIAAPYAIFSIIVCLHHFLWKNIENMKWLLFGVAISSVLSVFIFQPGTGRSGGPAGEILSGSEATKNIMEYSLFWAVQFGTWVLLPIQTHYLSVPSIYVYGVSVFMILFSLLSAGSRSGFGVLLAALLLMWLGGKQRRRMMMVRRNFVVLCVIGVMLAVTAATVYKYAAINGYMGEAQLQKYEGQTTRGEGVLALLISGRSSFFASFFAALDKPIVGHGSWPLDYEGYFYNFLDKYGTPDELALYYNSAVGKGQGYAYIPGHSQIMVGWTWYGIFGLIFWLYILYIYIVTLKNNLPIIPQWYGYLCLALPGALWNILFSPFGARIPSVLLFVLCLFVKAVADRRLMLPKMMQQEITDEANKYAGE